MESHLKESTVLIIKTSYVFCQLLFYFRRPTKVHISEEKMAAQMRNMRISCYQDSEQVIISDMS